MPLCGFNKKMLDGLKQFADGLYDQAEKRATEDRLSIEKSFDNEMEEMDIFLEILSKKNPLKFQSLIGITHLAQSMYRNGQGLEQPKKKFFAEFEKIITFLVAMDEKYYGDFRPGNDPKIALQRLGEWID